MLQQTPLVVKPCDIDLHAQAYDFGHEDATEGDDQRPSAYFAPNSTAWHAYNEGYRDGCIALAVLTGEQRSYWIPAVQHG